MLESISERVSQVVALVPETFQSYALALALFVGFSLVFKLLQWLLLARLAVLAKKTKTDIDDTLINIVKSLKPSFYYFFAFWLSVKVLALPVLVDQIIDGILVAWIAYQVVISLHIVIDYWLERRARKETSEGKSAFRFLSNIAKWALWVVAILMVLSNLGVNVTSLIAGLGIGGVAVALAMQNILGDLFSSFAIYFDKPFVVGDFIIVGEQMGTVEKIGIKTTRLRALQGEEIVISNKELTSTRIQNFRKMQERRGLFQFGILYETPIEKVRQVPEMVREIFESLETIEGARIDYANFRSFGDSSLDFEVAYFLPSQQYNTYLDLQQEINLKLLERFEKEGIGFAYPTRTVHLQK